jgi:hypothetical protein
MLHDVSWLPVNPPGSYDTRDQAAGTVAAVTCPVDTWSAGLSKQRACVPCPPGTSTKGLTGQTTPSACGGLLHAAGVLTHRHTKCCQGLTRAPTHSLRTAADPYFDSHHTACVTTESAVKLVGHCDCHPMSCCCACLRSRPCRLLPEGTRSGCSLPQRRMEVWHCSRRHLFEMCAGCHHRAGGLDVS